MRVLITGGKGQLAVELIQALAAALPDHTIAAYGRDELDITNTETIVEAFEGFRPDVVINTAAYHQVDRCETEPEAAFAANAAAPRRLAAASHERGALFVHISTDYVFGGRQQYPYREIDPVDPISLYGASKAAGEMAVRCTTDRHLIVRTTGLYGLAGRHTAHGNFVETMLRLAQRGQPLSVVCDQTLTPSSAADVAQTIVRLIEEGVTGTAHVTNSGECSWYDFAAAIFRLAHLDVELHPVPQSQRPMPAPRPAYSVLAHDTLLAAGLPDLRTWQEALQEYLRIRLR